MSFLPRFDLTSLINITVYNNYILHLKNHFAKQQQKALQLGSKDQKGPQISPSIILTHVLHNSLY